jgi:NADH:ubiquinone reductase (H+-translocating)
LASLKPNLCRRVAIVGGGFGGLIAASKLAGKRLSLTLIDHTNYHLFQPLLYPNY